MARRKLIAGNWKMNCLRADGGALAAGLAEKMKAAGQARTRDSPSRVEPGGSTNVI